LLKLTVSRIAIAFCLSSLPFSMQAQDLNPKQDSASAAKQPAKRLVADYDSGSKFLDPPYTYTAKQIPYSKITHILHAGVGFDASGDLQVPDQFIEPELIPRAHAAGTKVMLLLGGDIPGMEANPKGIAVLVKNLKKFETEYDYDGIDLDWEYPGSSDDAAFLLTLEKAFRSAFPSPRYLLSIDVAPWSTEFYNVPHVKKVIDWFNIMTYDCAGPWTAYGELNSPIFWDPSNPRPWECEPGGSDQQAGDLFLKHVPAEQLNMGTPFYGYFYTNISQLFEPCPNDPKTPDGFCDGTVVTVNYGPNIKPRIDKKGWQRYYDPVALVPYLVKADGSNGYITYDDEFSTYTRVYYSDWVLGLGGTFMWSLDADYDGHSQDLLNAMYQATMKSGEYR